MCTLVPLSTAFSLYYSNAVAATNYSLQYSENSLDIDLLLYTFSHSVDPASKEPKSSAGRIFPNCFARSPKPAVVPPTVRIVYLAKTSSLRALGKPFKVPLCGGSCTKVFFHRRLQTCQRHSYHIPYLTAAPRHLHRPLSPSPASPGSNCDAPRS